MTDGQCLDHVLRHGSGGVYCMEEKEERGMRERVDVVGGFREMEGTKGG